MKSVWAVEWDERAVKELKKLGSVAQQRIVHYLEQRVAQSPNPKQLGEALLGDRRGEWRYRVMDYRIICRIEEDKLVVLVLKVGHRKNVYH